MLIGLCGRNGVGNILEKNVVFGQAVKDIYNLTQS